MVMMHAPLAGASVVVARAAARGASLCEAIRAAGGEALDFPVIEIRPVTQPVLPSDTPDHVVFASVAAVEHGLERVRGRMGSASRVAAIGSATAAALEAAGMRVDILPERQESEGLLQEPAFADVAGCATWIVRGRGGRELLPSALAARGADVHLVEVYERSVPDASITPLLVRWRERRLDAVVIASRAGLENLYAMLDAEGRRFLRETQLVVPTERMLKLALDFDIRTAPVVADGASDEALLAALIAWRQGAGPRSETPQDSR